MTFELDGVQYISVKETDKKCTGCIAKDGKGRLNRELCELLPDNCASEKIIFKLKSDE